MTIEELKDIPFHFVAHMALESEHMMSYETEDKANKRESECTDPKHPLQRPCDLHWDRWMTYPHQIIKVNKALYRDSRDPYLETRQYTIDFDD